MSIEHDSRSRREKMRDNALDEGVRVVDEGSKILGNKAVELLQKAITVGYDKIDKKLDSDVNKLTKTELKEYLKAKKTLEENFGKELPKLSEKEVEELSTEEFQEYFTKLFGKLWEESLFSAFEDGIDYGENRKEYLACPVLRSGCP